MIAGIFWVRSGRPSSSLPWSCSSGAASSPKIARNVGLAGKELRKARGRSRSAIRSAEGGGQDPGRRHHHRSGRPAPSAAGLGRTHHRAVGHPVEVRARRLAAGPRRSRYDTKVLVLRAPLPDDAPGDGALTARARPPYAALRRRAAPEEASGGLRARRPHGVRGRGLDAPALAGDAAALPLRSATPHTVFDPVVQGVFQASRLHGAIRGDAAGDLHPHPIARKERLGWQVPALAVSHPCRVHYSTSVEQSPCRVC